MWAAASTFAYEQCHGKKGDGEGGVSMTDGGDGGRERSLSDKEQQLREGKCGEFAFIELMGRFGYLAYRDTQVWVGGNPPPGHVKGQDVPHLVLPDGKVVKNPVKIDVKTCFEPEIRRWILIEDRRDHADLYVKMGHNTPEGEPISEMNWISNTRKAEFYDPTGRTWWRFDSDLRLIRWDIADAAVKAAKSRPEPLSAVDLRTEMASLEKRCDNIYACPLSEPQKGLPPSMQRCYLRHLQEDLEAIYALAAERNPDA
jgi:hypothetical protein